MNTYRNLHPRTTAEELLECQARARRERQIAFGILVAAVIGSLVAAALLSLKWPF